MFFSEHSVQHAARWGDFQFRNESRLAALLTDTEIVWETDQWCSGGATHKKLSASWGFTLLTPQPGALPLDPQVFPQLQICHYTTDTDDIVLLMLFSGDTSADKSEFKAPTAKQTKKTEANLKCDDQSIEVSR